MADFSVVIRDEQLHEVPGPGRVARIGTDNLDKNADFLERSSRNPVNLLTGRELVALERMPISTVHELWAAADRILAARRE